MVASGNVGSRTKQDCAEPSRALKLQSPTALRTALAGYLATARRGFEKDWRDVVIGLAPFHDCARRLGVEPIELFDVATEDLGAELRELTREFARRSDVTLKAFGWTLATSADGPCYRAE